jgi:hypothetical protein
MASRRERSSATQPRYPHGVVGRARAALVVIGAIGAAGCFDDRGLAIEVEIGGMPATSVELYLGKTKCDASSNDASIDCTGIAPSPAGSVSLPGTIWFRDSPAPYTAEVSGGKATFRLTTGSAAGSDDMVPMIIAVGLDASGQTVGAATMEEQTVPLHGARVVTATLHKTMDVARTAPVIAPMDDEERVLRWKKPNAPTSCVVFEHWSGGVAQRDFVVPTDDPDCDSFTEPECAPAAYDGSRPAGTSDPDCFVPATDPPACVLGSGGCSDLSSTADMTACVPQTGRVVCAPSAFCACTLFDKDCAPDSIMNAGDIPRIVCTVPAKLAVGTNLDLCGGKETTTVNLNGMIKSGQCTDPGIESFDSTDFQDTADFGGAMMQISSDNGPCALKIEWASGTRTKPLQNGMDRGLVKITIGHREALVPIVFQFNAAVTCGTTELACTVTGSNDDSLWTCASASN